MKDFIVRYVDLQEQDIINVIAAIDGMPSTSLTESEWTNCQSILNFLIGDLWTDYLTAQEPLNDIQ